MNKPKYEVGQPVGVKCPCGNCATISETVVTGVRAMGKPDVFMAMAAMVMGLELPEFVYTVAGHADKTYPEHWLHPLEPPREAALDTLVGQLEEYRETMNEPEPA